MALIKRLLMDDTQKELQTILTAHYDNRMDYRRHQTFQD